MKTINFKQFIFEQMGGPPAPGGAPGGAMGMGGPPGGGMPPPPMGGMGGMGGLGGPGLGGPGLGGPGLGAPPGMGGGAPAGNPVTQVKSLNVWTVLEKILDGEPIKDQKPGGQKDKVAVNSPQLSQPSNTGLPNMGQPPGAMPAGPQAPGSPQGQPALMGAPR